MKLHQHSSFAIKLHSTLYLRWSHANIHFCPWSHINTSFVLESCQFSSLSWSHINTSFTLEPCQYSSLPWNHFNTCIEVELTFIFALTPHWHLYLHWSRTNIGLYNEAALALIFKGNIVQTSRVHSTVARHKDFRDANKTLKMQGVLSRFWRCKGNVNKTLKM